MQNLVLLALLEATGSQQQFLYNRIQSVVVSVGQPGVCRIGILTYVSAFTSSISEVLFAPPA